MKDYPMNVFGIYEFENGSLLCYVSKGHHEVEIFLTGIRHEFDRVIDSSRVRHRLARWYPYWQYGEYLGQALILTEKPGPGVFPVTVSWDF